MKKRIAVIFNDIPGNLPNVEKLAEAAQALGLFDEVHVYSTAHYKNDSISVHDIPDDVVFESSRRNLIIKDFHARDDIGFLHVIHDKIVFNPDIAKFISSIENAMTVLDYPCWMSTITDRCNYVMSKYNPRMSVEIDAPEFSKFNLDSIKFTSHSNPEYMIYDMSAYKSDIPLFNETFSVPMFFIIEFLARRRNMNPESLFFMNQYLTVGAEYGAFSVLTDNQPKNNIDKSTMQSEDEKFKMMEIDYHPDNNLDLIIERLYLKIRSKI